MWPLAQTMGRAESTPWFSPYKARHKAQPPRYSDAGLHPMSPLRGSTEAIQVCRQSHGAAGHPAGRDAPDG